MNEVNAPIAGWYDDPEMALRLRWWDGTRWTHHTRAKQIVEQPVGAGHMTTTGPTLGGGASPIATATSALAVPGDTAPYALSAPASQTPASAPQPVGSMSGRTRNRHELWNTASQSVEYVPERTTTFASWMLAATPLVTTLAYGATSLLQSTTDVPVLLVLGAAAIPLLWIIMWVRRDRITLHEWGHLRRASAWWVLLSEFGYLVARTIVIRGQTGRGWWPLVVNLACIAALINVGIFTPVFGVVRAVVLSGM